MRKDPIVLGVNANIDFLIKKGAKIKTGDSLIIYENSFEDKSINQLLDKLGSDFNETISDLSKNKVVSKYTGRVVDVVMYYNRDIEEFSPSVQKILKDYIASETQRGKIIDKNIDAENTTSISVHPINKQSGKRIKGIEVDGLCIEIYIEYVDELGIGDKISYYTALKSVISDVIKEGEEPYSDYEPEENIDAIVSSLSIVSRMCVDVYNALYLNKALIYLKKEIRDIYNK